MRACLAIYAFTMLLTFNEQPNSIAVLHTGPSRRRKRLSACRTLHLHIHPLVQALVVEDVATGRDHPSRQALHIQRVHADHALHSSISSLNVPLLPAGGEALLSSCPLLEVLLTAPSPCHRFNAEHHTLAQKAHQKGCMPLNQQHISHRWNGRMMGLCRAATCRAYMYHSGSGAPAHLVSSSSPWTLASGGRARALR